MRTILTFESKSARFVVLLEDNYRAIGLSFSLELADIESAHFWPKCKAYLCH